MRKQVLLFTLILVMGFTQVGWGQTTYTWNVASGAWTTAGSWTPSRDVPATNDVLVFDGSTQAAPSVTGIPKQTIGQLKFINNVTVTFSSLTATTGTGTIVRASSAVTGTGTAFTTEVVVGDLIYGNTTLATYDITAIGSNTSITTSQSGTVASQSFSICPRLSISGGTGTDFLIESGSTVSFAVTAAPGIVINLVTGTTGSIAGTIKFHNSGTTAVGSRILVADASGLNVTGTVEQATSTGTNTFSGNMFGVSGTGTANSVNFQSGSNYIQRSGSNPFTLTQPASLVVFLSGSNYKYYLGGTISTSGRTFANLIIGNGQAPTATSASADCNIENLTLESRSSISISTTGAGKLNISGNITQSSNLTGMTLGAAGGLFLTGTGT